MKFVIRAKDCPVFVKEWVRRKIVFAVARLADSANQFNLFI